MTPVEYRECVLAELDAMRSAEKNRLLLGLINQLFPQGDADHPVNGTEFIAEAVNLLAAFHPNNLKLPEEKKHAKHEPPEVEF